MKKYFPLNQAIDNELKIINKEIYLSMNGVCSDQIIATGAKYGKNFGVSWARIKELAAKHSQNSLLAERLWHSDTRESKLIATLLMPTSEMPQTMANEWIEMISTTELAEISAMALFSKLPYTAQLIHQYITHTHWAVRLTALHCAGRCAAKLNTDELTNIISNLSIEDIKDQKLTHGINSVIENTANTRPELTELIIQKVSSTPNWQERFWILTN